MFCQKVPSVLVPAGMIQELIDEIQEKLEIVTEELALQNISSSVEYLKMLQ
jgi:tetrahydromethanopterin S-methyltransferase subunit G